MAATYSTSGGGSSTTAQSSIDSNSLTIASGATVYAAVANSDWSPLAPTGVSLDPTGTPQAFTQIGTTFSIGAYGKFTLWRLNSASGVTALTRASWSGNQGERVIIVWSCTGADTTTPNGTVVQNSGTGTAVSAGAVSTAVGQLTVSFGYYLDTLASSISFNSPTGTERQEIKTSPTYDGTAVQDYSAVGASTTLNWTLSGSPDTGWAAYSFAVNDAGGGGGSIAPQAAYFNMRRSA